MDNDDLLSFIACSRFKTARRRKRLQKKDADKQLRKLNIREKELSRKQNELPLVPLEFPYQKGWKRFFVLRDDVARSKHADFYTTLLLKINTIEYSPDKSFKRKKRRRGKKVYEERPQYLRAFWSHEWNNNPRFKLSDRERTQFHIQEHRYRKSKESYIQYVFNEPWRYVLKIRPHMITYTKMVDEVLEQEIQQLENYIVGHYLRHKITKQVYGNCWKYYSHRPAVDPLKNNPIHRLTQLCVNDEI